MSWSHTEIVSLIRDNPTRSPFSDSSLDGIVTEYRRSYTSELPLDKYTLNEEWTPTGERAVLGLEEKSLLVPQVYHDRIEFPYVCNGTATILRVMLDGQHEITFLQERESGLYIGIHHSIPSENGRVHIALIEPKE